LDVGGRSLPAETLERRLPVRVLRHTVRLGSGGTGIHGGGDGEVRELELLAELELTLAGERRRRPPYGLAGGGPGALGRDSLQRGDSPDTLRLLPEKLCFNGHLGDRLTVQSPGGGGHGDPQRAAFFAALLT
jgi:N-methylhydantoinase B